MICRAIACVSGTVKRPLILSFPSVIGSTNRAEINVAGPSEMVTSVSSKRSVSASRRVAASGCKATSSTGTPLSSNP